jgi:hypothetical protein
MDGGKVFFVTKFCHMVTRKKMGLATHTKDVLGEKIPQIRHIWRDFLMKFARFRQVAWFLAVF